MSDSRPTFHVHLTADFFGPDGTPKFDDMGLSIFESHPHIRCTRLEEHRKLIGADQARDAHGIIVLTPSVTRETVREAESLLAIGRFGVGYDSVDVPACTEADVAVLITIGAVDRPVAEATVGWMIALTHHVLAKDRLVRSGKWDERTRFMGRELRDRTFGAIGLGGIARETLRLLEPFGMRQPLAHDPFVSPEVARAAGVKLVTLEALMAQADFVSIHCPLTDATRGLIAHKQLALMKPSAYLINTARGGIVDEDALHETLCDGKIAGAAMDCFTAEPLTAPSRFADLENMLLAPHSIAWTQELFRDIGRTACQQMVDLSLGRRPRGVVNPQVFDRPGFKAKWDRVLARQGIPAIKR